MEYRVIDRNNWQRKEYFEHYLKEVPCTYSITTKLDITAIKKQRLKLYPTMLYCITKIVNRYEQFRTAFRTDGTLVIYNEMLPCYTVFHQDTKTFSNIWTEFSDDYDTFCKRYNEDVLQFGTREAMMAKPNMPENAFTVSMIPWTSFDGFNLNVKSFDYLIPIFTIGKYKEENEQYTIPFSVQVHHAVCDGYHAGCFINDLQDAISSVPLIDKEIKS